MLKIYLNVQDWRQEPLDRGQRENLQQHLRWNLPGRLQVENAGILDCSAPGFIRDSQTVDSAQLASYSVVFLRVGRNKTRNETVALPWLHGN
jgi:hypothetical protein